MRRSKFPTSCLSAIRGGEPTLNIVRASTRACVRSPPRARGGTAAGRARRRLCRGPGWGWGQRHHHGGSDGRVGRAQREVHAMTRRQTGARQPRDPGVSKKPHTESIHRQRWGMQNLKEQVGSFLSPTAGRNPAALCPRALECWIAG
eukprot:gene60-biopygen6050